jgi:predicted nuclease with TOPRIM domain
VITGDQALALLGILGQASIGQTQLQTALAQQREANQLGAQAIEQLQAENAELQAKLDDQIADAEVTRLSAENDQLREEANHLRIERADLIARIDRLEHRGAPFSRVDPVAQAQKRDQS